jgi:hypothetical protein
VAHAGSIGTLTDDLAVVIYCCCFARVTAEGAKVNDDSCLPQERVVDAVGRRAPPDDLVVSIYVDCEAGCPAERAEIEDLVLNERRTDVRLSIGRPRGS